jgi:gliding motility-associated lipoprotein GldD
MIARFCLVAFVAGSIFALASCNSDYTPKPTGYFRVALPAHQYQSFDKPGYPYSFEYPTYAKIVQDSTFFDEQPENPYWINIDFPGFNGKIYISYNEIGGQSRYKVRDKSGKYIDSIGKNTLERLVNGSYTLTFKHSYKATSIDDSVFETANGTKGIFFRVGGNAATANQFLVTDSVKHFLRGALYFDATPNADSLGPVNNFLKEDMQHLINTLRWK